MLPLASLASMVSSTLPLLVNSANDLVSIAAIVYSGQAASAWYYINLLFTVLVCVGGVIGMFGSCFVSRTQHIEWGFSLPFYIVLTQVCQDLQRGSMGELYTDHVEIRHLSGSDDQP